MMTPTPMSCSVEEDGRSFTGTCVDLGFRVWGLRL